jgi:WD40 repeat protein
VTFLNVSYIGNTLITSGDDGFIYLWEGYRIVRRIPAHQGAIYALHCNSKLGYMVSGGMDGKVVLWRF